MPSVHTLSPSPIDGCAPSPQIQSLPSSTRTSSHDAPADVHSHAPHTRRSSKPVYQVSSTASPGHSVAPPASAQSAPTGAHTSPASHPPPSAVATQNFTDSPHSGSSCVASPVAVHVSVGVIVARMPLTIPSWTGIDVHADVIGSAYAVPPVSAVS